MSEQDAAMKKIAESPVSWAEHGAEAFAKYKRAAEDALSREIELINQRNSAMQHGINMLETLTSHQEKMFQIQHPHLNDKLKGTDEWAKRENEIIDSNFRERESGRRGELNKAIVSDAATRQENAIKQKEAKEAEDRAKALKDREIAIRREAQEAENIRLAKNEIIDISVSADPVSGEISEEGKARARELEAKIARSKEEQKKAHDKAQSLPAPKGEYVTKRDEKGKEYTEWEGETVKSAQEEAYRKRKAADAAEDKATASKMARDEAEKKYQYGKQEDEAQVKQDKDKVSQEQWTYQYDPKMKEGKMPEPPPLQPHPPDVTQSKEMDEAKKWLSDQIGNTNNMGARNDLMNLRTALLDGKGSTEGELAAIQNLMAKVAEGKTNAITALHQTMQDVAGMSENMARSVTNIAETLKAQAARIEALKAETESIRNQMRTN